MAVATEDGGSDVRIARSNLPIAVTAALNARFPGAKRVEAELSTRDGTPVYEVSAEFNGRGIDVRLTRGGIILETEQALTPGELPQPVLDWVRQNFPGAVIAEAELVSEGGAVSYEVRIATPGRQEFEATLRVPDAQSQDASRRRHEAVGDRPDAVRTVAIATTGGLSGPISPADTTAPEVPLESRTSGRSEQAPVALDPAREQTGSVQADAVRTAAPTDRRTLEQAPAGDAEPQDEAVADVNPTAWLPQVAGVIRDLLPIDVAVLEQGLQQILDEIDALAERVVGDTGMQNVVGRVVIVAALITGARLVLLESRESKREPVLALNAANSSWSWILGAATPKRP